MTVSPIIAARRGYAIATDKAPRLPRRAKARAQLPATLIGIDCETLTDDTQRLTFGSATIYERVPDGGPLEFTCTANVLFYADGDDVPANVESRLRAYAEHTYDGDVPLEVVSQTKFLSAFYEIAVVGRALVFGFNLPFDLSRIARGSRETRQQTRGGFSLILFSKTNRDGTLELDPAGRVQNAFWKPVVQIKSLGPKKASIAFSRCHTRGEAETYLGYAERENERIRKKRRKAPWSFKAAESLTRFESLMRTLFEAPAERYDEIRANCFEELLETKFQYTGCFVDVSTLCRALTDRGGSLAAQCKKFGVEHKGDAGGHPGWGFDDAYITYNLRDTRVTSKLLFAALADFYAHPIDLDPWKAYSSASIGKAYFRAWGITPPKDRWPDFPKDVLGICTRTFNGGATNVYFRRCPLPVVYTDIVSSYPTTNGLLDTMALWRAANYRIESVTADVQTMLEALTYESCFDRGMWPAFKFFAKIELDGQNLLPVRGVFTAGDSYRIGLTHVMAAEPDWFAGPDIVASIVATGRVPKVVEAFRIEPVRNDAGHVVPLGTLRTVDFAGAVPMDPRSDCIPVELINERKRAKRNPALSDAEKSRIDTGLKCVANSSWYGTAVEKNVAQEARDVATTVYSGNEPFAVMTSKPEENGEYTFEPIGALITAAAHLELALVREAVKRRGGSYVLEDTDSCAIIATEAGGVVPCSNGPARLPDGRTAVHALSWAEVREVVAEFESLNPYDVTAVGRSILKIEDVNYAYRDGERTGDLRQLYAYAISSKRYALFAYGEDGKPTVTLGFERRDADLEAVTHVSESGLGGIISPIAGDKAGAWVLELWQHIIDLAHDAATPEPDWFSQPVVARFPISSVVAHRAFAHWNAGKSYDRSVKPYSFAMTARLAPFVRGKLRAIAPYDPSPENWLRTLGGTSWFDLSTGKRIGLGKDDLVSLGSGQTPALTFSDLANHHARHEETKMATVDGTPHGDADGSEDYAGPLHYRHVRIVGTEIIGKESTNFDNELAVVLGELAENDETQVFYKDEKRKALRLVARDVPIAHLQKETKFGKRKIEMLLYGQRTGNAKTWAAIERAAWLYLHLKRATNVDEIAAIREKRLVRERNALAKAIQAASDVPISLAEARRRSEAQLRAELPGRIADAFALAGIG